MAKVSRRRPMAEINVVPYIDVMLVLLVIFMVTAPMLTQGIVVDLPEANLGPLDIDENETTLVVSIKADGSYYINVGEDEEAVPLAKIEAQAKKIMTKDTAMNIRQKIILQLQG